MVCNPSEKDNILSYIRSLFVSTILDRFIRK